MTEDDICKAKVEDIIKEGKTYEFRVKAINKGGEGEPSVPTKPIICKSRFVTPFIVGDKMNDIIVRKGQYLSWDIKYGGEPDPEVEWYFNDVKIAADERITLDKYEKNTVITVRKTERKDTGKYKLVLTNSSGTCETFADGVILGRPSMPQGPIEITDVRAKKATLHWEKPEDDGGCPITHYIIERQDVETGRWVPCGEAGPDDKETIVDGLSEGKNYKFRIKAVNKEG